MTGVYDATIEKEEFEFIKAKAQIVNEIEVGGVSSVVVFVAGGGGVKGKGEEEVSKRIVT